MKVQHRGGEREQAVHRSIEVIVINRFSRYISTPPKGDVAYISTSHVRASERAMKSKVRV